MTSQSCCSVPTWFCLVLRTWSQAGFPACPQSDKIDRHSVLLLSWRASPQIHVHLEPQKTLLEMGSLQMSLVKMRRHWVRAGASSWVTEVRKEGQTDRLVGKKPREDISRAWEGAATRGWERGLEGPLLRTSEGTSLAGHLDLDFRSPELGGEYISVLFSLSVHCSNHCKPIQCGRILQNKQLAKTRSWDSASRNLR